MAVVFRNADALPEQMRVAQRMLVRILLLKIPLHTVMHDGSLVVRQEANDIDGGTSAFGMYMEQRVHLVGENMHPLGFALDTAACFVGMHLYLLKQLLLDRGLDRGKRIIGRLQER
ncbi:hypothetical protein D3C72_1871530 [compost metagenome]